MAELRHVAIGGVVGFCKYEWLMAKNDRQPGIKIQTSFQRGLPTQIASARARNVCLSHVNKEPLP
jgi:hypothetical protein